MIKPKSKLGKVGHFLNMIKPTADTVLASERLKTFPLKLETK